MLKKCANAAVSLSAGLSKSSTILAQKGSCQEVHATVHRPVHNRGTCHILVNVYRHQNAISTTTHDIWRTLKELPQHNIYKRKSVRYSCLQTPCIITRQWSNCGIIKVLINFTSILGGWGARTIWQLIYCEMLLRHRSAASKQCSFKEICILYSEIWM